MSAAYESGHVVYFSNRAVELTWRSELLALRVTPIDMARVSKHGATKTEELFAKVTVLVADGRCSEVPERILKAYDAAMQKAK